MTSYLIDTHVFIWLRSARARLRPATLATLADPASRLFLSAASAAELFDKYSKGGETGVNGILAGGDTSLRDSLTESGIAPIDVTFSHAAEVGRLPPHHRDPVDRILIAQAAVEGLTLVSSDRAFERYGRVQLLRA
jgi:PIN domain nuclease of toxin-antitoxin system